MKTDKTHKNFNDYGSIIAEISVKLVCKENTFKGNMREIEMNLLQENDSNSILPNNSNAILDKYEYNNLINKLKHVKIVRKDII